MKLNVTFFSKTIMLLAIIFFGFLTTVQAQSVEQMPLDETELSLDEILRLKEKYASESVIKIRPQLGSQNLLPPPNDNFAASQLITGTSGSITGTNVEATSQAGEPNSGNTVWYRITTSAAISLTFDTFGSDFDTIMGIYTGNSVTSLTQIALNDDSGIYGSALQSRIVFNTTAGGTYYIQIKGINNVEGNITLRWNQALLNDNFANALPLPFLVLGNIVSHNNFSTGETSEPNPNGDSTRNSVWFKWTPQVITNIDINTIGSGFDTTLGIYTGSDLSTLALVGFNDDDPITGSPGSRVRFTASPGITYYIAVDGYNNAVGSIVLRTIAAASNNNFTDSTNLFSETSGRILASNINATLEASEPNTNLQIKTIWFSWTPTYSRQTTFETCDSSFVFDTIIYVYTGSNLTSLSQVANDDDGCGGFLRSRVTFNAVAGTTYRIRVGTFSSASPDSNQFYLTWGSPFEDNFGNDASFPPIGNNFLATEQAGEPNHTNNSVPINSVWYQFTPTENTNLTLTTQGSFFDTTLSVYSGSALSSLMLIAENDNESVGVTHSRVTFFASAGTTYHIAVDGAGDKVGYFFLNPSFANVTGSTLFDFDGDSKSDISIFRPSVGEWYYIRSGSGQVNGAQFGSSSDKPTPADYTGDGKTDIAFYQPSTGEWYVLRSEDFSFYAFPFGATGDIPSPGDFDGDGKADAAVFRPSNGVWYINKSTGGVTIQPFGTNNDRPVVADYDGDGKSDIAIFRPSVGEWYYLRSSDSQVRGAQFGALTDKTVQGDYTGDGKADFAFFRPSTGSWFVLRSEDSSFFASPFGVATDIPTIGDYDGDGKFDQAVFRPSNGVWYINRSTAGVQIQQFGVGTDLPLPAYYLP